MVLLVSFKSLQYCTLFIAAEETGNLTCAAAVEVGGGLKRPAAALSQELLNFNMVNLK